MFIFLSLHLIWASAIPFPAGSQNCMRWSWLKWAGLWTDSPSAWASTPMLISPLKLSVTILKWNTTIRAQKCSRDVSAKAERGGCLFRGSSMPIVTFSCELCRMVSEGQPGYGACLWNTMRWIQRSELGCRGKPACVQPAGSGRASGRSGVSEQRSGPAASVQNVQWGKLGKVSLKTQKHTQGLEIYFHTFFLQVLFDMKLVSSQGSHL